MMVPFGISFAGVKFMWSEDFEQFLMELRSVGR
mgnify:CR=1 FL=1